MKMPKNKKPKISVMLKLDADVMKMIKGACKKEKWTMTDVFEIALSEWLIAYTNQLK